MDGSTANNKTNANEGPITYAVSVPLWNCHRKKNVLKLENEYHNNYSSLKFMSFHLFFVQSKALQRGANNFITTFPL